MGLEPFNTDKQLTQKKFRQDLSGLKPCWDKVYNCFSKTEHFSGWKYHYLKGIKFRDLGIFLKTDFSQVLN